MKNASLGLADLSNDFTRIPSNDSDYAKLD